MQNVSEPPKTLQSHYHLERSTDCTQYKMMQPITIHSVFPLDSIHTSETSVVEYRRTPDIPNAKRLCLSNVKNTTNAGIVHHSLERKPEVMVALHEGRSGSPNSWYDHLSNTSAVCDQTLEALKTIDYFQPIATKV